MPIAKPVPWVVGSHIYVALEGATLSDAGNVIKPAGDATAYTLVGRESKPSPNDTSWVKLGNIVEATFSTDEGTEIPFWEPASGRLVLNDVIRAARRTTLKAKAQLMQALAVQLALDTQLLNNASSQFNPHGGPTSWKCWVKLQGYNHLNSQVITLEFWGEVMSSELKLDGKGPTAPEYSFALLHSVLNTGSI